MVDVNPAVALTIAGSDSGGAAGLQADLKTFAMHGVFGTSVLTVLTAQNSVEIRQISPVPAEFVAAQLAAVLDDLPVAAVKTGMLATLETITTVAEWAPRLPQLVVDPVLVSTDGVRLFSPQAERAYLELLFPFAAVATPNMREASVLLGREVSTVDDAVAAATDLAACGPKCVVVKGGQRRGTAEAVDVVWLDGRIELLRSPWIETANIHGSGDAFGATIASGLARGWPVGEALALAKEYVHDALSRSARWTLGGGHGPLGWPVR
jgi:hydroxymethylpyrimidine/phosphomethylpyrimidine kinase